MAEGGGRRERPETAGVESAGAPADGDGASKRRDRELEVGKGHT
jgi:hypothetical protein